MKKILYVFLCCIMFISCDINRDVSGVGIPSHCSHIEFWNGGACIGSYDNANV